MAVAKQKIQTSPAWRSFRFSAGAKLDGGGQASRGMDSRAGSTPVRWSPRCVPAAMKRRWTHWIACLEWFFSDNICLESWKMRWNYETPGFFISGESSHVRPGLQVLDLLKELIALFSHNACELHECCRTCSWLDQRCKIYHRRRQRKTFGAAMLLIDGGGSCRPLCRPRHTQMSRWLPDVGTCRNILRIPFLLGGGLCNVVVY